MRNKPSARITIHEAFKRYKDTITLHPKLKRPDKNSATEDASLQTQGDPKFAKQILGFREWCEKIYARPEASD